jgi:hypothetical protein
VALLLLGEVEVLALLFLVQTVCQALVAEELLIQMPLQILVVVVVLQMVDLLVDQEEMVDLELLFFVIHQRLQ